MSAVLFILLLYVIAMAVTGFAALYEAAEDGKFDEEIMERRLANRRANDGRT